MKPRKSRQPTPGERLVCNRTPLARLGNADRQAMHSLLSVILLAALHVLGPGCQVNHPKGSAAFATEGHLVEPRDVALAGDPATRPGRHYCRLRSSPHGAASAAIDERYPGRWHHHPAIQQSL